MQIMKRIHAWRENNKDYGERSASKWQQPMRSEVNHSHE